MQISEIRSRLIKRREQILEQSNSKNTSWQKLKEPEVEFEETAAKEKMVGVLAQLDDREFGTPMEPPDKLPKKNPIDAISGVCDVQPRFIS